MKYDTGICGPQKMSPTDFDDPLTFSLAPPASQGYHLFSEISQHRPIWHQYLAQMLLFPRGCILMT